MKSYKKHHNSGPVPYPDQSGRFLTDEIVHGEEWEPFVALDYVVAVDHDAPAAEVAPVAQTPAPKPVEPPAPEPVKAEEAPAPEPDLMSDSDPREAQKGRRKRGQTGENQ